MRVVWEPRMSLGANQTFQSVLSSHTLDSVGPGVSHEPS